MRRSNEPFWWAPFSAGMLADALALPALVIITGILIPLGMVREEVRGIIWHPLGRLVLFAVVALTFFHAAHKLRFTLTEMGLRGMRSALGILCYGAAIVGTLFAGAVALGLI